MEYAYATITSGGGGGQGSTVIPQVTGVGTEFTADDENKRVLIQGKTYVIKQFISPTEIQLTKPYQDATETGVRYSLGPKLVGEPWEVKHKELSSVLR